MPGMLGLGSSECSVASYSPSSISRLSGQLRLTRSKPRNYMNVLVEESHMESIPIDAISLASSGSPGRARSSRFIAKELSLTCSRNTP